jgi:hypothetical protein
MFIMQASANRFGTMLAHLPRCAKTLPMPDLESVKAALAALESPAAARNTDPICAVLPAWLPDRGRVLELACGALQHARALLGQRPDLQWQPTDIRPELLSLAQALPSALGASWPAKLATPAYLDACKQPWPFRGLDVIYTANLLHIAPMAVTDALFAESAQALKADGALVIYGPFREAGRFRSDGDARFDESLRTQSPELGIRDLEALAGRAADAGLALTDRVAMPANNLLLRYQHSA